MTWNFLNKCYGFGEENVLQGSHNKSKGIEELGGISLGKQLSHCGTEVLGVTCKPFSVSTGQKYFFFIFFTFCFIA